jgi:hypothetical protein
MSSLLDDLRAGNEARKKRGEDAVSIKVLGEEPEPEAPEQEKTKISPAVVGKPKPRRGSLERGLSYFAGPFAKNHGKTHRKRSSGSKQSAVLGTADSTSPA